MKLLKFLSAFTLVLAVILSLAFKPATVTISKDTFVDQVYKLNTGGNKFNPLDYTLDNTFTPNATTCPSESKVCAIVIPLSEVYTSETTPLDHQDWIGKPMVDAGNQLSTDIATAVNNSNNDPLTVNGHSIYERN